MRVSESFVGIVLPSLFLLTCTVSAGDDASKKKERAHSHLIEARRLAAGYKIDKAADKARDALKDDPKLAEAHVYLGLERFRANDLKAAEAEFNKALEMDPYQAQAHCELGYVLYEQGQLEPATDHSTMATRLDPTSPRAFAGVALSQFKHWQEGEALKTFDKGSCMTGGSQTRNSWEAIRAPSGLVDCFKTSSNCLPMYPNRTTPSLGSRLDQRRASSGQISPFRRSLRRIFE